MSRCRSCNAPIRWVRTAAGKAMPIDPAPDLERGNLLVGFVGGEEIATILTGNELASSRARRDPLHLSHFATCPQAAAHRRPLHAA
jgi:hypothetical protein